MAVRTEGGIALQSGLVVQAQIHYPTVDFAGIPIFLDELAGESHSSKLPPSTGDSAASASSQRRLPV